MKLVCMGDSLTEGYNINLRKRWTELIAEEMDIPVVNSGICGDTTGGMLARFQTMVIEHRPTHVIIMGGTNDLSVQVSKEVILSHLLAMSRHARYHQIQCIIGLMPHIYIPLEYSDFERDSQAALQESILDFRQYLKDFFEADGLKIIDFSEGLEENHYLEDGVHPSELGHQIMGETALELLQNIEQEGDNYE